MGGEPEDQFQARTAKPFAEAVASTVDREIDNFNRLFEGVELHSETPQPEPAANDAPPFQFDWQSTTHTSGPCSLQILLSAFTKGETKIGESALASFARTSSVGTDPADLLNAAKVGGKKIGLNVSGSMSAFNSVGWNKLAEVCKDPNKGAILHIKTGTLPNYEGDYGHYVYLAGVDLENLTVKIADPARGVCAYSFADYEKAMSRCPNANTQVLIISNDA